MRAKRNIPVAFYMHSGSGNHGCEAIVVSLSKMLAQKRPSLKPLVTTNSKEEDEKYIPDGLCEIAEENHIARHFFTHTLYYIYRKLSGDRESFLRYRFKSLIRNVPKVAVGIGGDTYCYDYMVEDNILTNRMLHHQNSKTILLGCSVEPDLVKRPDIVEDMKLYEKILARESITYEALLDAGVPKEKVMLVPDPAFTLPVLECQLPMGFEKGNTIGINLSPLVEDYAKQKGGALKAYEELIKYILSTTDFKIALIPHVFWERSDDLKPLNHLYRLFEASDRVIITGDMPASNIKYIISSCRMFIGARTHATIAAYSTCVPTLVLGYSVKARGIAKDLFGSHEHYVLPVQSLLSGDQLIEAFNYLYENEDDIRNRLKKIMPSYIEKAHENANQVIALLEKE